MTINNKVHFPLHRLSQYQLHFIPSLSLALQAVSRKQTTLKMNSTCLPDDILDAALESAAETLIQCLQTMPELQGAKVAIVGGMAVRHHLKNHRPTSVSGLQNQIYQIVLTRACRTWMFYFSGLTVPLTTN
jgi:hypothetical protein